MKTTTSYKENKNTIISNNENITLASLPYETRANVTKSATLIISHETTTRVSVCGLTRAFAFVDVDGNTITTNAQTSVYNEHGTITRVRVLNGTICGRNTDADGNTVICYDALHYEYNYEWKIDADAGRADALKPIDAMLFKFGRKQKTRASMDYLKISKRGKTHFNENVIDDYRQDVNALLVEYVNSDLLGAFDNTLFRATSKGIDRAYNSIHHRTEKGADDFLPLEKDVNKDGYEIINYPCFNSAFGHVDADAIANAEKDAVLSYIEKENGTDVVNMITAREYGYTWDEIARALHVKETNARKQISRARKDAKTWIDSIQGVRESRLNIANALKAMQEYKPYYLHDTDVLKTINNTRTNDARQLNADAFAFSVYADHMTIERANTIERERNERATRHCYHNANYKYNVFDCNAKKELNADKTTRVCAYNEYMNTFAFIVNKYYADVINRAFAIRERENADATRIINDRLSCVCYETLNANVSRAKQTNINPAYSHGYYLMRKSNYKKADTTNK